MNLSWKICRACWLQSDHQEALGRPDNRAAFFIVAFRQRAPCTCYPSVLYGDMDDDKVPTIGDLQESPGWVWVCCEAGNCNHAAPVTMAQFVIRWGPQASSNRLRREARCKRCGHRGASLRCPSWITGLGMAPLPEWYKAN